MKITQIKNPIVFKSGYPTFGSDGHLNGNVRQGHFPDYMLPHEEVIPGDDERKGGILIHKINYFA